MRSSESKWLVAVLGAVATFAAGCSGCQTQSGEPDAGVENPDAGGGADAGDGCTTLTLGERDFQTNVFGQLTGVRYPVSPGLGGAQSEALLVELYDSTTPGLPALAPGEFDLGTAPDDSLATCQHCVWIPLDWDGFSPLTNVLFATEGSMTVDTVEDPLSSTFAGSLTDVVFREAALDDEGAWQWVDGGQCARVAGFEFDTTPTPGRDCLSATDCGNPLLEVCSPETNTCAPIECGDFLSCPPNRPVCLTQYGNFIEGACYTPCDPTGPNSCGVGKTCLQLGPDPQSGICKTAGDGVLGDGCTVEDNSTMCVPGLACSTTELICTRTCAVFAEDPGCQAGHVCSLLGFCEPPSAGDPAKIGEACSDTSQMGQSCGAESGAFRGVCHANTDFETRYCKEACLGDSGCEPEEFCAMRFTSGLGICLPDPVCGDGALGEIDEVCDDGNTISGDGCSSDCQTVEYGVICSDAPLLEAGTTSGDTTSAWDGFMATCQTGYARADVYRFDPPSRGRLRLKVDSTTTQLVSLRSTCDDVGSELACHGPNWEGLNELFFQVTDDTELTVLVSAYNLLEQGPYTLETEFVPEQCGDGVIAGLEVCDDGNTLSNDGCSSDCATVEYAVYCGQSDVLITSVTGDNTGAPRVYTASCANTELGSGPDRLYTFTAPSSGTAHFRLEPDPSASMDLALSVFDTCGDPASMTELACSSVYDIEQVDVPVTAGQKVTVLVEGYNANTEGAYTLSVEMLP